MAQEFRILVVDDNEDIHDDYRKALDLYEVKAGRKKLRDLEELLFSKEDLPPEQPHGNHYRITSAYQGEEGYATAMKARMEGAPFAVAFVDVRMPPGLDGIQTTRRLLADEPDLEIVLCSAYSDYPWERIKEIIGLTDRVLFLRKPFDVIEVKQMAEALSQKWHMRVEARRTTAELVRAKEEAQAASREKSSFLSNMSHEIRTPLNGVIGMADLLRGTSLQGDQKEFVAGISYSAKLLLELINNILDFSKIESGKLVLEEVRFDLHDLVKGLRTLFRHTARGRGLDLVTHLTSDLPRFVLGDPTRIRQVMINFLSNALKFTDTGGVEVRVSCLENDATQMTLRCEVQDTGIGISDAGKAHLFQTFSQIDASTTRKYGGSGLGLVISKMLSKLLGGTIGMESRLGEGSMFWFTFTVRHAGGVPTDVHADPVLVDVPVLVLSAREAFCDQVGQALRSWGCRVRMVDNTQDGLEVLSRDPGETYKFLITDGTEAADTRDHGRQPWPWPNHVTCLLYQGAPYDWATAPDDTVPIHLLEGPVCETALHQLLCDVLLREPFSPSAEPPLVLIAEDNRVNQKVVSHILERAGYRILLAANGLEAVALHEREDISLIVMDCQMPDMDGYEATRLIRAREAGLRHTPILALTANAVKGDRELCLQAGMDDYITKPIVQTELLQKLREMLTRQETGSDGR